VPLEDVLDAVSAVRQLAGMLVVQVDPVAASLAGRYGVSSDNQDENSATISMRKVAE
jgi:hypothetical protein